MNREKMAALVDQYRKLCDYCDRFFGTVTNAYPYEIQCRKGCAQCCTLSSVSPLEAYLIKGYLNQHPESAGPGSQTQCHFLHDHGCLVYPVRPVICRTHGVPIRYEDQAGIDVCPKNFRGQEVLALAPEHIFPARRITENLMRLNMAFNLLHGESAESIARVMLCDLQPEGK